MPNASWAQSNAKIFVFANSHYVITAEVGSVHSFILNFINLSDFVIVVQPNEFIYKGASGRFYIGQVYERGIKDTKGQSQKYSASILLKGHSFTGLTMVGSFQEQDQIVELSVRIGAKRYYLQPVDKSAFEQLAAKISKLDLNNANSAAALAEANISEMGNVKSTDGSSEWDRDWEGLITPEGVNPPKIIERPEISATPEARKARTLRQSQNLRYHQQKRRNPGSEGCQRAGARFGSKGFGRSQKQLGFFACNKERRSSRYRHCG